MNAITNLAAREGYIHTAFAKQVETVGELGILYAISDFENEWRVKLGLPKLPTKNLEISEIYKITGLDKLLSGIGRKKNIKGE